MEWAQVWDGKSGREWSGLDRSGLDRLGMSIAPFQSGLQVYLTIVVPWSDRNETTDSPPLAWPAPVD